MIWMLYYLRNMGIRKIKKSSNELKKNASHIWGFNERYYDERATKIGRYDSAAGR